LRTGISEERKRAAGKKVSQKHTSHTTKGEKIIKAKEKLFQLNEKPNFSF
jgi:hypothetical protein